MSRRDLYSAIVLVAVVLAAAWLLAGCGEVPTAPSSSEESARFEAGPESGGWTLTVSPPANQAPRGLQATQYRSERRVDGLWDSPDVGGSSSGNVAETFDPGRPPESRYALAHASTRI